MTFPPRTKALGVRRSDGPQDDSSAHGRGSDRLAEVVDAIHRARVRVPNASSPKAWRLSRILERTSRLSTCTRGRPTRTAWRGPRRRARRCVERIPEVGGDRLRDRACRRSGVDFVDRPKPRCPAWIRADRPMRTKHSPATPEGRDRPEVPHEARESLAFHGAWNTSGSCRPPMKAPSPHGETLALIRYGGRIRRPSRCGTTNAMRAV